MQGDYNWSARVGGNIFRLLSVESCGTIRQAADKSVFDQFERLVAYLVVLMFRNNKSARCAASFQLLKHQIQL